MPPTGTSRFSKVEMLDAYIEHHSGGNTAFEDGYRATQEKRDRPRIIETRDAEHEDNAIEAVASPSQRTLASSPPMT